MTHPIGHTTPRGTPWHAPWVTSWSILIYVHPMGCTTQSVPWYGRDAPWKVVISLGTPWGLPWFKRGHSHMAQHVLHEVYKEVRGHGDR